MSKIGKKPVIIPDGVEIKIDDGFLEFKKGNESLKIKALSYIEAEIKDNTLVFKSLNTSKQARANWGTIRALSQNAIDGLTKGFFKNLEIEGVGYRVNMEGDVLVLNVGLSHPIKYKAPMGVNIVTEKNVIKVSGIDKFLVGKAAAEIRKFKKAEPYQGKGIKYQGEIIRRKVGKKMAGATK